MGRGPNSKSQISGNKKYTLQKGDELKKKSMKHKEKIESSRKVDIVPKSDNLYKSDKKNNISIIKVTVRGYDKKFKLGKPLNLHKRGSSLKVRKIRGKNIRPNPNMKKIQSPAKISVPYGECVVCMDDKHMTHLNTIKCGNVAHVLCTTCKEKIKDNNCPLCRSHPIDSKKQKLLLPTYQTVHGQIAEIISGYARRTRRFDFYDMPINIYSSSENYSIQINRVHR
mgnify:FL=1